MSRLLSLTLGLFWSCARATLGPPPLEAPPETPPLFMAPRIDPTRIETWSHLDQTVVSVGDTEGFALVRWVYAGDQALDSSRKLLERQGVDAMRALLAALGAPAAQPLPLLPPPVEHWTQRKLYHLWLCDAACIEVHLDAAGAPMSAAAARAAYVRYWNRSRAEGAKDALWAQLDRQFLDLDPKSWRSNGPWWLGHTAGVVPYIGGEPVRIGVGQASEGTDLGLRRITASNRALARLARDLSTSKSEADLSEAVLRHSRVVVFEQGPQTWALAICDDRCEKRSASRPNGTLGSD